MSRNHPTPDKQRLGDLPAPGTAAMASPAPGGADLVPRRQLENSVSWSGRERLRCLWYRLRLTAADINYATRRTVELQAPWISDTAPAADAVPMTRSSHSTRPTARGMS
jgi:hypothetical protein